MVDLLHEIWVEAGDDGAGLEGCCLAGPDGERFRRLLSPSARRTHTFTAGSHFEAMTNYYRLTARGAPYVSLDP